MTTRSRQQDSYSRTEWAIFSAGAAAKLCVTASCQIGFGAIEFLICRKCGVYVSAYAQHGDEAYANVMVTVLDERKSFPPLNPVYLDGENEADKRQHHRNNWTLAILRGG